MEIQHTGKLSHMKKIWYIGISFILDIVDILIKHMVLLNFSQERVKFILKMSNILTHQIKYSMLVKINSIHLIVVESSIYIIIYVMVHIENYIMMNTGDIHQSLLTHNLYQNQNLKVKKKLFQMNQNQKFQRNQVNQKKLMLNHYQFLKKNKLYLKQKKNLKKV